VRTQLPIILDDWSEPEPDVAVCVPDPYNYTRSHPTPQLVLLVCEVAASSLIYDRSAKAAAYAASGIPEYWIVNVEDRVVYVLTEPDRAGRCYGREAERIEGDILSAPGGAAIAVTDVLPPR
jgi:Uma2 family endonuclease